MTGVRPILLVHTWRLAWIRPYSLRCIASRWTDTRLGDSRRQWDCCSALGVCRGPAYQEGGAVSPRGRDAQGVEFDPDAVKRRWRSLARSLSLEYLGMFHSHVDENGLDNLGHSYEDCEGLYEDPDACIDGVVYIWQRDRAPRRRSSTSLYDYDEQAGMAFAVRIFGKARDGIERITLSVMGSGA